LIGQDSYFDCICILANKILENCDPRCHVIQKYAWRTGDSTLHDPLYLAAAFIYFEVTHNIAPLGQFETDLHERCKCNRHCRNYFDARTREIRKPIQNYHTPQKEHYKTRNKIG
jgi:hypothetical protein